MAIRKTVEDVFVVRGVPEDWFPRCENALQAQGFTSLQPAPAFGQIRANYKKATLWGTLDLTLIPENQASTRILARATANIDNVFAAFKSPGQKIIDRFKQGLR